MPRLTASVASSTPWPLRHSHAASGARAPPCAITGLSASFVVAFVLGLGYAAWALICRGGACPSIQVLDEWTPQQTSKLYAADGRFIAEIGLERRTLVKLNEIPKHVRDAFVITEDKRFYDHAGIDWFRVAGAAGRNLVSGSYTQGFDHVDAARAQRVPRAHLA